MNLLYGIHAAQRLIEQHPQRIAKAYVLAQANERLTHLVSQLGALDCPLERVTKERLHQLASGQRHQGVCLEVASLPMQTEHAFLDQLEQELTGFFLVLDGVSDPHNLGACIRSAEAFGANGLIIPKDNSASLTPVARKVACGAAELLPVYQVTNLVRAIKTMQDFNLWVYGTGWSEQSTNLFQTKFHNPCAVVMGSEGKGLRQLTAKNCDQLVTIYMPGITESLNVSVATGIMAAELVRQGVYARPIAS